MGAMQLRVSVLDSGFADSAPMWGDAAGGWAPPGVAWYRLLATYGVPVRALASADDDDGEGLLLVVDGEGGGVRRDGPVQAVGPPPQRGLDALRVVRDELGALVRPDLRGVVVPRIDDPGSSMRRLLRRWAHPDVTSEAWHALWAALRGFGRASIFCCPAWVDADGTVRESREASPEEWGVLDAAAAAGLVDLECHGFTHLHPDLDRWSGAPDRFDDERWYRELAPPHAAEEPLVEAQAGILAAWQAHCGPGTTVVAPGEAWGLNTVAAARERGFRLFNSWEICRLDLPVPTWTAGVGSPYLDRPHDAFKDDLPVVVYWHDRDMAVHGPEWVPAHLAAWRDCGARRAMAFADLAAVYAFPPDAVLMGDEVVVHGDVRVPLIVSRRGEECV